MQILIVPMEENPTIFNQGAARYLHCETIFSDMIKDVIDNSSKEEYIRKCQYIPNRILGERQNNSTIEMTEPITKRISKNISGIDQTSAATETIEEGGEEEKEQDKENIINSMDLKRRMNRATREEIKSMSKKVLKRSKHIKDLRLKENSMDEDKGDGNKKTGKGEW